MMEFSRKRNGQRPGRTQKRISESTGEQDVDVPVQGVKEDI